MHVMVVIGTRPEAIKMAPVVSALRKQERRIGRISLCLTAQHRALCDQVIGLFHLEVDHDLDVMQAGQSIYDVTHRVMEGMNRVFAQDRPDLILVHGDTTTTFAAALAAYYSRIQTGHVEAGLRTHDKYSPYPEEMNRRLADALCDWHYAPTAAARDNLLAERISSDSILVTGNTVIDALLQTAELPCEDAVLEQFNPERRLIVATMHRRESFGAPLLEICRALLALVEQHPDVEVALPVHPNPQVSGAVRHSLGNHERILLLDPLEYLPFVHLLKRSYMVLTDSGGIQEEAPSLGKPVLVLRDVTERPEAAAAGVAKLVGPHCDAIVHAASQLLKDPGTYAAMACAVNPYGDGKASERIAEHVAHLHETP